MSASEEAALAIEAVMRTEYPDTLCCKAKLSLSRGREDEDRKYHLCLLLVRKFYCDSPPSSHEEWEIRRREVRDKIVLSPSSKEVCSLSIGMHSDRSWIRKKAHTLQSEIGDLVKGEFLFLDTELTTDEGVFLDIEITTDDGVNWEQLDTTGRDGLNWDLVLKVACKSFEECQRSVVHLDKRKKDPFADQKYVLNGLLQRKKQVYKALQEGGAVEKLQSIHILTFTESMWKHREEEKREAEEMQRKIKAITKEMGGKLEQLCKSPTLSLGVLKQKLKTIPSNFVKQSPFFYYACANKNITLEVIQCLLEYHPGAASIPTKHVAGEVSFPIHSACANKNCPGSVIELLAQKNTSALNHLCTLSYSGFIAPPEIWYMDREVLGTPLHYYLWRGSDNIDLDVVRSLVYACPDSLIAADKETKCSPMHLIADHPNVDELLEVIDFMITTDPSTVKLRDRPQPGRGELGSTPLHTACSNPHITCRIVRLLINGFPESASFGDPELPIHFLCQNGELDATTSLEVLSVLLEAYPETKRREDKARPPLNLALHHEMSTDFCKMLFEACPETVRETDGLCLPIHEACDRGQFDQFEMAKLLIKAYPESIAILSYENMLPIHYTASHGNVGMIKFLLALDPDGASRVSEINDEGNNYECDGLPLHFACSGRWGSSPDNDDNMMAIKLLFDAYPEGVEVENEEDGVPIDLLRRGNTNTKSVAFLESQTAFVLMSRNTETMTARDSEGMLPLHNALCNEASLGSAKLLVAANPDALRVASRDGSFPLHLACALNTDDVVECLLEQYDGCLNVCDSRGDLPLHIACRRGNYTIVNLLLANQSSIFERNTDGHSPVHLLCDAIGEDDSVEDNPAYLETIWRLLLACPETVASF